MKDSFQNLIAIIALVFCLCNFFTAVRWTGECLGGQFGKMVFSLPLMELIRVGIILNSTVNLMIYLIVSENFRREALTLMRGILPSCQQLTDKRKDETFSSRETEMT